MEIERKKQAEVAYTEATLVASFILGGFGGKNPPKIEELFPDIYEATKTEEEKEAERAAAWQLYKEQFIDYADSYNKQREKRGDNNWKQND